MILLKGEQRPIIKAIESVSCLSFVSHYCDFNVSISIFAPTDRKLLCCQFLVNDFLLSDQAHENANAHIHKEKGKEMQ